MVNLMLMPSIHEGSIPRTQVDAKNCIKGYLFLKNSDPLLSYLKTSWLTFVMQDRKIRQTFSLQCLERLQSKQRHPFKCKEDWIISFHSFMCLEEAGHLKLF